MSSPLWLWAEFIDNLLSRQAVFLTSIDSFRPRTTRYQGRRSKVKVMNTNQVSVESLQSRALALVMGVDRIFLFRELFVALALILVITGLVFA